MPDQVKVIASAAEEAGGGGKKGWGKTGKDGDGGSAPGGQLSIMEAKGGEAGVVGMSVDGGNGGNKRELMPGTPGRASALRKKGDPPGELGEVAAFPVGNGKGTGGDGGGSGGGGGAVGNVGVVEQQVVMSASQLQLMIQQAVEGGQAKIMTVMSEMRGEIKGIKENIDGVRGELAAERDERKKGEEVMGRRMKMLEEGGGGGGGGGEEMEKKIKEMEQVLADMRMEKKGGVTAIIGGLSSCDDMEEAVGFLKEKLGATLNDEILETYFKGDVFKGLIFMMFTDPKFLKLATNRIQAGRFKHNDHSVWMNEV